MGTTKTLLVKRKAEALYSLHRERFTKDFEQNKRLVDELASVNSRKLRNIIAGYVTRLVKQKDTSPHRKERPEGLENDSYQLEPWRRWRRKPRQMEEEGIAAVYD